MVVTIVLIAAVAAVGLGAAIVLMVRRRGELGTSADRATFDALHTASLAAPSLREGLTVSGAQRAVKPLRSLLGTTALVLVDRSNILAVDGVAHGHARDALRHAGPVLKGATTTVLSASELRCDDQDCPIRSGVASSIVDGDTVVGAIVAYSRGSSAMLVRAMEEVARWVSAQIELGSADLSRSRLVEAELRALRAQISPHFIYNSLTAIASFVRTDPDRARELLLEFADFTRYALRQGSAYTTVAEELRNTERYLVLEQARFGERLTVSLRVAPEVLPTALPYLVIQPLVENAVRHGLEGDAKLVTVIITVEDAGSDALISVEDDGAGSDPDVILRALVHEDTNSVGLGNVDSRLRQIFGDPYGLIVETAPDAGTRVSFRVPKFAPGVHAPIHAIRA